MCRVLGVAVFLAWLGVLGAAAQVRMGPSPEMRALLEAFREALNGTADEWEAFAQQRFSADLLAKRTPAERRRVFEQLRADFGRIAVGGVTRGGPSAPIALEVEGATGVAGTIGIEVDDGSPPRITSLSVEIGNKGGDPDRTIPAPPVDGTMSPDELSRALDGYLAALAADDRFSGVALVAREGSAVFHKAYGLANRADKVPNTTRTRFNIGSINKTFTQIAIHQLAEHGKLAYTDTLGKFFPDYPQAGSRGATVEQLLSHRAGLADIFGPEFARTSKAQFRSNQDYFRFIGNLPALFAPGARLQYCNGCYIALGAIVERVSGMPYERYVAAHVFTPASMPRTGYPHSDAVEADVAVGYTRHGPDEPWRSNVLMHGAAGSAGGGGYSTAEDLLSFVNAVRAGRFPGAEPNMGIAGGAPGISAVVEAGPTWTVIVLTNTDGIGERVGSAVARALRSGR